MLLPKENQIIDKINSNFFTIVYELFKVSLLTYFISLTVEIFEPGFITSYFDLNIILYIVVVTGLIVTFFSKRIEFLKVNRKNKIISLVAYIILSIAAGFTVYYQIKEIGNFSKAISILVGIIIFLISYSIMNEDNQNEK